MKFSFPNLAGRLIVFEGSNEVGKTSISGAFSQLMGDQGLPVTHLSFPGRAPGTLGSLVYRIHHNPSSEGVVELSDAALQGLHVAAHLDAIERMILPHLADGRTVVLDRFWWSTWVYGLVAGVSPTVLSHLIAAEKEVWGKTLPMAIFLVERGLEFLAKGSVDAYRDSYREIAATEKDAQPIFTITNSTTIAEALEQILNALEQCPPND